MKKILFSISIFCFSFVAYAQTSNYFNGFETSVGAGDWGTTIIQASGFNGIPSSTGSNYGETTTDFTRFGGYNYVFPTWGFKTSIDIYLNVNNGYDNDKRFEYTCAISSLSAHRRDFVFNGGFYNDATGPGTPNTNRFIFSTSFNTGGWPKNPGRSPIAISATGWYTFEHYFYNNGGGVLAVDLKIYNDAKVLMGSWTLSDPTDIIGTTVGGNRYGWFATNQLGTLAIDNSTLTLVLPRVHNLTQLTDYLDIQPAINAANPGDVIQVDAGVYPGNIIINKSIALLGDPGNGNPGPGVNAPIIEGGGANIDAFKITNGVSNVTLKGFIIQNFSSPGYNTIGSGIQAWVGSTSNITVQDNNFLNLGYNGILVGNDYNSNPIKWGDHNNWLVTNNIVENCGFIGFELTNTSNSSVENNIIHLTTPYIGAIFSSARRSESGLTIKNNYIDGTPSSSYPVIYVYAYDLDMTNPNLDNLLIEGNTIATIGTPYQVYIRNIGTGTITNANIHFNSLSTLKNLTSSQVNATCNWWGSASGPSSGAVYGDVVVYPWLGSFPTTVCGVASLEKQLAKDALNPYVNVDDKKIRDAVNEAINEIDKSLAPELWVDANHLSDKGKQVFYKERNVAKDLMNSILKKYDGQQVAIDAMTAINHLIAADEILAEVAISEVVCNGSSNCEKYSAKAMEQMAKALDDYAKGKYDKVIDDYKKAWDYALKAADKALPKESADFAEVPTVFSLGQNYPNPFNPTTTISYQVPVSSNVEISIFNSLGQKVATLLNEFKDAGNFEVQWNASNLSSGIYFYKMNAGDFVSIQKMILMK